MKKYLLLIGLSFAVIADAQVLCVQCFDQNSRVLNYPNNLILNGGFETTTCIPDASHSHSFCPNSSAYDCDFLNWTCTGGGINTYASLFDTTLATNFNLSLIVEGNNGVYFGNDFCNICTSNITDVSCLSTNGCQVEGIPSGFPYNSTAYGDSAGISLSQTVTGLTPGYTYGLEFWTGGEWQNIFLNDGVFAVDIGFGNIFLWSPPTPPVSGIGRRFVILFEATSGTHTIKFTNWGHIGGTSPYYSSELVLDDVQLFQLPNSKDPCTLALNDEPEGSNFSIFPNPVADELNIMLNGNEPMKLTLYDLFSVKISEREFVSSSSISTLGLPPGIYYYELRDRSNLIKAGKIIKR